MHIISLRRLHEYWKDHASAKVPLKAWYEQVKHAKWQNFAELKRAYPSADQVKRLTVFNIGDNNYRLIERIEFIKQRIYIRSVMSHAEYDKDKWKNDPWYN